MNTSVSYVIVLESDKAKRADFSTAEATLREKGVSQLLFAGTDRHAIDLLRHRGTESTLIVVRNFTTTGPEGVLDLPARISSLGGVLIMMGFPRKRILVVEEHASSDELQRLLLARVELITNPEA